MISDKVWIKKKCRPLKRKSNKRGNAYNGLTHWTGELKQTCYCQINLSSLSFNLHAYLRCDTWQNWGPEHSWWHVKTIFGCVIWIGSLNPNLLKSKQSAHSQSKPTPEAGWRASWVHFATSVESRGEWKGGTSVEIGSITDVSTDSQCRAQAHVG